jgi:large subunit ribosomal protein L24e
MAKCAFCSVDVEEGTGKMIIQKTGKMNLFCSSKCRRSLLGLGRDPRRFKWAGGQGVKK